ncbi:nucleoside ABC transporter membrane protein [Pseudooceanicola antarcticus]|uniref:ABC transporter permease n=1 Tax=Pseudooceanicola antarcticus TaxID=1247613 RepID=A0A285JFS1_9RHOB|nr:ABC transporter permease [Pseudooceanicola antarcticus]PJE31079.1 ABC transporter permease [Pseudooceanicola antarcticus]SNY58647.1 nucleoside ABC transporter membrane protein [Pseudooceanicola antarcticus]
MSELAISIFTGTLIAATPLLLAALGELVVEKSGVLNLGIEGMMLIGAAAGFLVAVQGGGLLPAFAVAALAGAVAAALFGVLTLLFLTNQYAAGLALAIFGSGVSATLGVGFGSQPIEALAPLNLGPLADLPLLGPLLFRFDIMVYLGLALVPVTWWWLNRSRAGLVLRVVGEAPGNAHALGYNVLRIRFLAILWGGALAGLAGGYLSLAYTAIWVENMTAGRGWIALSLVVFATWRPFRVLAGAVLFGGVTILQLHGQILGLPVPSEALSAAPYVATILVLVVISQNRARMALDVPLSLGKPFRARD